MKTLLLLITFFVVAADAATVRLYFTDPLTNEKDTNAFYITPIGTNILSNGGVVGRGITTRYVPASNGYRTNTLAVGHYSITNRSLGAGVVIRVPESSSLYDYTNLLVSGYNIFVTIENGTGVGTVQTNISYTAVTNITSFGAITNGHSALVILSNDLAIGPIGEPTSSYIGANGYVQLPIQGFDVSFERGWLQQQADGLLQVTRDGGSLTNLTSAIAADTVVSNGIVNGLAAGSYNIAGNGAGMTNVNATNIVYDINTVASVGDSFRWETTNASPGRLMLSSTLHGTARGIVLLGGTEGDVVINPDADGGILQIGLTGNTGNKIYVQYATTPNATYPLGFSHPLQFRSKSTNTAASDSYYYFYPGIMSYVDSANASELGRISIYARAPHWNTGNYNPANPNEAGTKVADFSTNGVVAASGISFKGDGQGVTNQNYAIFQRIWFNGTTQDTYPNNTWTNVTWTTNLFSGQNHDSGSCFTLSNSFLIVNATGAGRWRVHSDVSFFDATTTPGNSMTRLYKFNNTPGTLMPGTSVYVPSTFDSTSSKVAGSITLAAGDIIALQCYVVSSSTWTIGNIRSGFSGPSDYQCGAWVEFERQ